MKAGQYLTFKLNGNLYGLEIRSIREIKHMQPISALPDVPAYMKGVINLRDRIIPIMDLRNRFGFPESAYTKDSCIIVVEYNNRNMGLIVDAVDMVTDLNQDQIDCSLQEEDNTRFVKGIGKLENALVMLIDIKNCFEYESHSMAA